MQNFTIQKAGIIFGLIVLLLIALEMISGIISERTSYRNEARFNIARSWTGEQKIIGPVLAIPYKETVKTTSWNKETKEEVIHTRQVQRKIFVMPEDLEINSNANTETRSRGMYQVPVYTAQLKFQGQFSNKPLLSKLKDNKNIVSIGQPYLSVFITDIRGIPSRPTLIWNQEETTFISGSHVNGAPRGMHAVLPDLETGSEKKYPFSFDLTLRGMENLSFAPLGMNTLVTLESDWPHPSFTGSYLPEQHHESATGFNAAWRVSSFSSDIKHHLEKCKKEKCNELLANTFGVALIQPVDIYHQSERSVKYGILFISLTFVAIIVFEIIKKLNIHPIQYLLVGLALAIFYLLLVSLSEHIAFHWAYLIATVACTVLLCFYLTGVMRSFKQGLFFSLLIATLYGILFVILRAEDFALLMGCLLLFSALALCMFITRHIDWYEISARPVKKREFAQEN